MSRLAYINHPLFEAHDPGAGHPESPQRLKTLQAFLEKKGFLRTVSQVQARPASPETVSLNHDPAYIDFILQNKGLEHRIVDHGDTVLSADSVEAAFLAAGAGTQGVDLIFDEGYDKVFAAVRPPGHHALFDRAMGFCIFNNIAVAARYALQFKNLQRVLIIDWDVHHGNGTQDAFYHDSSVFYLSLHQFPFYPMSGRQGETGAGKGAGFTRNIPLAAGSGDDKYVQALEGALADLEKSFQPQLILISAGFDAFDKDPIGGMNVTEQGFYKLTEITARFAQRHCAGRIISFLEGGYHLQGLAGCVYKHLQCLLKH